jgi:hypothetical protein
VDEQPVLLRKLISKSKGTLVRPAARHLSAAGFSAPISHSSFGNRESIHGLPSLSDQQGAKTLNSDLTLQYFRKLLEWEAPQCRSITVHLYAPVF